MLPAYEAHTAFTVNSAYVFREDLDIELTIVDDAKGNVGQVRVVRTGSK